MFLHAVAHISPSPSPKGTTEYHGVAEGHYGINVGINSST